MRFLLFLVLFLMGFLSSVYCDVSAGKIFQMIQKITGDGVSKRRRMMATALLCLLFSFMRSVTVSFLYAPSLLRFLLSIVCLGFLLGLLFKCYGVMALMIVCHFLFSYCSSTILRRWPQVLIYTVDCLASLHSRHNGQLSECCYVCFFSLRYALFSTSARLVKSM